MKKPELKILFFLLLTSNFQLLTSSCAKDQGLIYKPSPQIMPQNIKKIALRPFQNKTQQFALEDKLTLKLNTRFITDGTYKITSETESDGVLTGEITRYIHIPVAYNPNLIATQYKLDVIVHIGFVETATNTVLWEEQNLVGSVTYPAPTLPGGMTEEQARELVWEQLAKKILKRTIEGFGSVTGESKRRISPEEPPK